MLKQKKGFAGAVSTLIMFIAVISVTTGLVIAFMNYVNDTQHSFSKKNELSSNKLKTSISVTNIYYNSSSSDLYIYVKNIGETKLSAGLLDLYINNNFNKDFSVVYANNLSKNMTIFQPQDTMAIIKNINIASGTHEITVSTQYGVGDSDSFNI
jgi:archaellum component FlaG (FlaF/FlaG flagellin family)